MPYTMQQVCDRARTPLNDAAKDRYSDPQLLDWANDCVKVLRRERPDLFFGQFEALPGDLAFAGTLPVPDEFFPAVSAYVTGMAETVDDEHVNRGRADLFLKLFGVSIGGGGA